MNIMTRRQIAKQLKELYKKQEQLEETLRNYEDRILKLIDERGDLLRAFLILGNHIHDAKDVSQITEKYLQMATDLKNKNILTKEIVDVLQNITGWKI